MPVWVGYAAMATGLLPALAVLGASARARRLPSAWWWLATAFGISFLADVAGLLRLGFLSSQVYPVLQAGIFLLVLLSRPAAVAAIGGLLVASGISLSWRGAAGLDLLLHLTAWGAVALAAWTVLAPGWLRWALVVAFGGGAAAWGWYVYAPGLEPWLAYQGTRLAGAVLFAIAAWQASRDLSSSARSGT